MGKLAQYRFLKQVKKILDTPVKQEEIYNVSTTSIYIGDRSSRNRNHGTNPNKSLRQQQVSGIASDLLLQINRIEKVLQCGHSAVNEGDVMAIDKTTGKVVWDKLAYEGEPKVPRHPHNSYAAATPALIAQIIENTLRTGIPI